MIITRTPYRISLMGGGSDYPRYYEQHGGAVLTTTINKYCHVLLRKMPPFLGTKYRVFWSKAEAVDRREDIEHRGVRGCLEYLNVTDGLEVNHAGDLPARTGLGSSSCFTVGMLHALHALDGERPGRAQLADEAIKVEQDVLQETVGIQDQIQCAWGGTNVIEFDQEGRYTVRALRFASGAAREIESHLMLLFTGIQRYASDIADAQVDNVDHKQKEISQLVSMVPDVAKALERGEAEALGHLLHEGWLLKRELSDKVTTPEIDYLYEAVLQAGAYGGKLLGAGGGGFMLVCAPLDRHKPIAYATRALSVPVEFEHRGSEVVLAAP